MNAEALVAQTISHRYLPNGKTRLLIEIDTEKYPRALSMVVLEGQPLGVAPLLHNPAIYHAEADALVKSRFLNTRALYSFLGTDDQYQNWVRKPNLCARSGRQGHDDEKIEFAHFRSVGDGSGTGIKPKYSGIPLMSSLHALQHLKGYKAVGGKEWFRSEAARLIKEWASEVLLSKLGFDNWNQVPPRVLFDWASDMGLEKYLPKQYRVVK